MKQFFGFYIFATMLLVWMCPAKGFDHAKAPGDIIIGGLFPIHESPHKDGPGAGVCDRYSKSRLIQSLAMIQAVEEVNKGHELGNLSLGYHILDSCGDVTTALKNALSFMKLNNIWRNGVEQPYPPVLAVVGAVYSEISIAVTRLLNLEEIPQVSYASTCGQLSDKTRFPSFMRTVPEDDYQVRAIIEILKNHSWTWVGLVATDSETGSYAVQRLQWHAKRNNICFAFISILPEVLTDTSLQDDIKDTVKSITENQNATVIVSFAKVDHMIDLFKGLLKDPRGRGRVWVASDYWSGSKRVLNIWSLRMAGTILGIILKSGNTTKYKEYLRNLDVNPDHHKNNTFLHDYLEKKQKQEVGKWRPWKPGRPGKLETANEELMRKIHPSVANVELAVRAVVQAISDLCVNRDCKTTQRLQPWEVLGALKTATFYMDGIPYKFDKKGDLNTGYDVVLCREMQNSLDVNYVVAQYSIQNQSLTFISKKTLKDYQRVTTGVTSRCSHSCSPGYRKHSAQGQPVCCYECHKCPLDYFSNTSDSAECHQCNTTTHYSAEEGDRCLLRDVVFLMWDSDYQEILLGFTCLGILLTIIVGIIFFAHWNTPVVRASVGPIGVLLLFSLLSTFASVIPFGGEPVDWRCQTQQVLFGLSFTLCVSCIMVKSFKIIMAFEFDPSTQRVLRKLYQPYLIIAVCMLVQALICALWLALEPPKPELKRTDRKVSLHRCRLTSYLAFGAMLSYIGILALICFGLAFKGRKLPQSYNDAKFIIFSMLNYFICWIIFGPVYANSTNQYRPAVEMAVILITAYGVLFCQFITKSYIILFKQKANTQSAFLQDVRNFTMRGSIEEKDGDFVPSSLSLEGIQNPALDTEVPASNPASNQSQ
ncbi:G-protein coupled receptor family C group 6 member A-like [Xyrichtys novacula]|uniref:G-protein coupled receptor family C group 6 member A n=1 Tax=Xyrichtys novacula TaxID=13765 RepID=A0AAV1GXI0_XYRNO|nr:G-protein coupled receptor family C group 6 member A-like [Xyrichtys novacula]